jgi:predicted O-methyltransferase YrrM
VQIPLLHTVNEALQPIRRRLRARLYDLLGRPEDAAFWRARIIPGMFRHDEMRLLYRTARAAPGPGEVAEIGSWKGRTAVLMALALRDAGQDCKVYAIDHHQGGEELLGRVAAEGRSLDHFLRNIKLYGLGGRIQEMVMPADQATSELRKRGVKLRLAFIDGAHDEESVREDIRNMLPLMQPGAVMAFHDFHFEGGTHPGVGKAFYSELADRVDVVDHTSSLLITRLRS